MALRVRWPASPIAPTAPRHFRHHAIVRDADPRLFDGVVRYLRQRLYAGPVDADTSRTGGTVRTANLRQGMPRWVAAACIVAAGMAWRADAAWGVVSIGLGIVLACVPRKDVWLVAHPGANENTIDLWLAGSGRDFGAEFATLVAATMTLNAAAATPPASAGAEPARAATDRLQKA